jgi:hypothetical protein
VALGAALLLLAMSAREMLRRGAPARARTIVSRTGFSPRQSEEALLLLAAARHQIPDGATVVFINDRKPDSEGVNYAVAVGQLPRQRVLPAAQRDAAEYLVLLHGAEGGEIVRQR